jgi:hypothetical protein
MKPGKSPTPHPDLDLERIWKAMNEEPPGPIVTIDQKTVPRPRSREHPHR